MLKRISALLAGIMLMGSFSGIAAFAAPVEATVFEDNFENYANAQELEEAYAVSEGQNGRVTLGAEGENQVINVALVPPDGTTMVTKYFDNTYSTGNIILNYSVKPGSGLTTMFYLIKDGDVQEFPRFETDGKMYLDWNETVVGDYTAGVWYDVAVAFNLDRKTYDISVKKQGSDEAAVTKTGVPTGLPGVNGLRMQVWTNSEEQTCFDNVSVKHAVKPVFPYTQDFESGDADGMRLVSAGEAGCGVVEDNGNKVYKLGWEQDKGAPQLVRKLNGLIDGKLYIDADLKPMGNSKNQTQIFMNITKPDGGSDCKNLIGFESPTGVRSGWEGPELLSDYTRGAWYHVNMVIDVASGRMNATIRDGIGTVGSVHDVQVYDAGSAIEDVYFQIWTGGEDEFVYIDNVSLKYEKCFPYTQDFEAVNADGMVLENGDSNFCQVVDCTEGYGKIYRLVSTDGFGAPSLKKYVGRMTGGKFGIEADLKPMGKENCQANVFLTVTKPDGSTDYRNLLGFSCETGVRIGWNGTELLEDYDGNAWHHIRLVIDVASGVMDALIYDSKGAVGSAFEVNVFEAGSIIENVYFQRWGNKFGVLYLDNVNMTDTPEEILKSGMSPAITCGTGEITTLEALKAAETPNVSVAYENYTQHSVNASVYIACFENGRLTGLKEKELNVNANETKGKKSIDISDVNFAGADCVRVFIWDSLETMTPCSEKLELR